MKQYERIESLYGPQSAGDNPFTAKARLLQSVYRIQIGEAAMGVGPNEYSRNKVTKEPSYYGNMLLNGSLSQKNFFFKETFEYAEHRVENKRKEETIDKYRLFNNLLSSMPLAFNLFHPLMMIKNKCPGELNQMVRNLFPALPVWNVEEILIEFVPTPIFDYTNDKSAMDAAILFSDEENNKYIIAIETKYTDCLGLNKAEDNEAKVTAARKSGLFTSNGLEHIQNGCTQMYRNFLLTEKYRMVHQLKDSFSIILAPKDHPTTEKEITSLRTFLKQEYHYKLEKYSLEDFVSSLGKSCPKEFQTWLKWFFDRYLDFSKIEPLLKVHD